MSTMSASTARRVPDVSSSPPWEMGSAFPLILGDGSAEPNNELNGGRLFGSGRQALRALATLGRNRYGWRAVHVPTYYCPEVVDDLKQVIDVRRYVASPQGDFVEPALGTGEAVLVASYFGRQPPSIGDRSSVRILDVTHDPFAPWIADYPADYVVASLRKTLPLPDGGWIRSLSGRLLPEPRRCAERQLGTTIEMLTAMSLKAAYIAGAPIEKATYLRLFKSAESHLRYSAPGEISVFSQAAAETFPIWRWREKRVENIATLEAALDGLSGLAFIPSTYGVVLHCASHRLREAIRLRLISHDVYPAVLWALDGPDIPRNHIQLSRRILFLHADFRWTSSDLYRAAHIVRDAHGEYLGKESEC